MDPKIVESELKNHKIREGPIYKRTKFLQEWRERWMVLSMNYILIFTNRNLKELVQFIDLKEVKTYKSYLRKEEDMIPAGFKIRTLEDMSYFCARNSNEKWTWLVSLERLMDFKYAGKSPYNNADWIKTKGFMSQREYDKGKFDEPQFEAPPQPQKPKQEQKPKEEPKITVSQVGDEELTKRAQFLDEEILRLKQKEEDMNNRQTEQEQMFLFELNKLKKTEEYLKELQLQLEEKAQEAERIATEKSLNKLNLLEVIEHAEESRKSGEVHMTFDEVPKNVEEVKKPEETVSETTSQVTADKPVEVVEQTIKVVEQTAEVVEPKVEVVGQPVEEVQKQPEVIPEAVVEQPQVVVPQPEVVKQAETVIVQQAKIEESKAEPEKKTEEKLETPSKVQVEQKTQQPKKEVESSPISKSISVRSKRIEDMKKFFESKTTVMGPAPVPSTKSKLGSDKKIEKKDEAVSLHLCRDRVVVNLLEEFHPKAYNYPGLRNILQFLITMCSERSLGYQSFLIREAKANQNRFLFAEVLLELINDYKKYDQFVCIAKIIEILIFEAPGIFKLNHFDLIRRKLVDLVSQARENHPDMPTLLKTLYVVHKMKNLEKNEELKVKLASISGKMLSAQGKNWARKLIEDI